MLPALLMLAGAPALPAASLSPGLAPLERLAGWCWTGEMAPGVTDTHCFTAVFGGQHLRDVHRVEHDGKVIYQGETLYSREGDAISFTYINALGGVGHGTAEPVEGGLRFSMPMRGSPAEATQTILSRWDWREGGYQAVRSEGATQVTVQFHRAGAAGVDRR